MSVKSELEKLLKPVEATAPKPAAPPAAKLEVKGKDRRTLGNIYAALEAQRVYSGAPSVQKPQAPPANLQGQGTAPALGTTGAWGKTE